MTEDNLLEQPAEALLALAATGQGSMTLWSDEKKREFTDLFHKRSNAARYILFQTAKHIIQVAQERHYISQKVAQGFERLHYDIPYDRMPEQRTHYEHTYRIGGRSIKDLEEIAQERAKLILAELPPVKTAIQIIDPETSKKMALLDIIHEKLAVLKEKVEEIPTDLSLAEVDQSMTVGALRAHVKDLEKKRKALISEMSDLGQEGQELEVAINKKLFLGLPGLSEAVQSVAQKHIERYKALDTTSRRVEERVNFGDDSGALEILKGFEKDEVTVSDSIKAEFQAALEQLKLAKPQTKKLTATKRKKP